MLIWIEAILSLINGKKTLESGYYFSISLLFTLLLLELYNSFFGQEKSLYLFYRDFQNIGLTVGLILLDYSYFL